ncbi:hypothetical protein JVT61DRAFT_8618 [Boletus reticuloceps]|uniref:Uncharacterized protein n=1 Tax=Boletus reticuloceps TaxID=495285 RepID=A0A8I3ACL6_9AGAM|nr:hypothetical protein JVT61DRAFT_8618 [Boletus reticuloceps]
MSYTKTLTFRSNNLGTDATLMLIFNKALAGSYDKFPVVWKVTKFGVSGQYQSTVTFSSQSLNTGFQPVLRGYITSDYQEGQIVKGQISVPYIFEQDLSTLDDNTTWNLSYDTATGKVSINQA